MPLKLVCPNCRADVRLSEPLPLPGAAVQCERCATAIAVTYPPGVIEQLKARGKRFVDSPAPAPSPRGGGDRYRSGGSMGARRTPSAKPPRGPEARGANRRIPDPSDPSIPDPSTEVARHPGRSPGRSPDRSQGARGGSVPTDREVAPTELDAGVIRGGMDNATTAPPSYEGIERTVGSMRSPYGDLPNQVDESEGRHRAPAMDEELDPVGYGGMTQADPRQRGRGAAAGGPAAGPAGGTPPPAAFRNSARGSGRGSDRGGKPGKSGRASASGRKKGARGAPPPKRRRGVLGMLTAGIGCLGSMGMLGLGGVAVVAVIGVLGALGGYWYFSQDLPTIEHLRAYRPPTVTTVLDSKGNMMGEIFEEKRFVVPTEEIPDHVKNAFLAAEDANFYYHGGIDYMGIVRAILRNALKGRKAQGASTITQQVARGFLLTNEKTLVRKTKEVILSWRIEEAYEKDHILFLYLNKIFLGAQSYGVEAASRTYYGKSVRDISVAEAAILAGLPQRPSDYSPYKGWDKARARQEYVLEQMERKGFITAAQHKEALAEEIKIQTRENKFRSKAPFFTEHVRRYLVEKYGLETVQNGGLTVKTTCDLDLQTLGQSAVRTGVYDADWRMGYRRNKVKTLGKGDIAAHREAEEQKLREAWAHEQDPAGRVPVPAASVLEEGEVYDAVITGVDTKWATFGIGAHDAVTTIRWNDWVYEPNPKRSWRSRSATNFKAMVDSDDDGKRDAPILQVGDLVKVKVRKLSSKDPDVAKSLASTPGGSKDMVAVTLFQIPEVEAALLSMDLATGAVRTMVGGHDFNHSEFNRTVQAKRQVGSTFKPIVYAAAIESKRVTAAQWVADAPLAMATANEFVWKPTNYGANYEGNMTMRQALAKSKNTCTVRILEAADPGMNRDVIYNFGRRLGIGGPPTYALPDDWRATPETDHLCVWVKETRRSTICMDRFPDKSPDLTDAQHRAQLGPDDTYMCRACDMSMGLGSASLTMEEMLRAYSAFATGGKLIEPYYIEEVRDGRRQRARGPRAARSAAGHGPGRREHHDLAHGGRGQGRHGVEGRLRAAPAGPRGQDRHHQRREGRLVRRLHQRRRHRRVVRLRPAAHARHVLDRRPHRAARVDRVHEGRRAAEQGPRLPHARQHPERDDRRSHRPARHLGRRELPLPAGHRARGIGHRGGPGHHRGSLGRHVGTLARYRRP